MLTTLIQFVATTIDGKITAKRGINEIENAPLISFDKNERENNTEH